MRDQYDRWFERGQRLRYESFNLEEYIENRMAESYGLKERLCNLELDRKKEVERRERGFANEPVKRKAKVEKHKVKEYYAHMSARKMNVRKRRRAVNSNTIAKSNYFGCARKWVLTPI